MKETAYLYFHQGWTDIINQLCLINYYSEKYKNINLIIREDSKEMIDFYVNPIKNVNVIYSPLISINECDIDQSILNNPDNELIFHGLHDKYRNDNFKNAFWDNNPTMFFVKKFFVTYGIDYMDRINRFDFVRDYDLEEQQYLKFKDKDYALYHADNQRSLNLKINSNLSSFDLNKSTNIFFDYIKILENAKEIDLIDSIWAALIYLLDAKYNLFKNIPITIHSLRGDGYKDMFINPIKLNNWTIC